MESRVQHTGYLRSVHAWWLGEALAWGTARRRGAAGDPARPARPARRTARSCWTRAFRDLGVGVARGARAAPTRAR